MVFLQGLYFDVFVVDFEHIDVGDAKVIRTSLFYFLLYFAGFEGGGKDKFAFKDVFVEGEVVFGEVGREKIEIKLVIVNGNASEDQTNTAHLPCKRIYYNLLIYFKSL